MKSALDWNKDEGLTMANKTILTHPFNLFIFSLHLLWTLLLTCRLIWLKFAIDPWNCGSKQTSAFHRNTLTYLRLFSEKNWQIVTMLPWKRNKIQMYLPYIEISDTLKILKKTITEKHATLRLSSLTNQGNIFYSEVHTWPFFLHNLTETRLGSFLVQIRGCS